MDGFHIFPVAAAVIFNKFVDNSQVNAYDCEGYLGLSRREMLELPVPQNGIYRLDRGKVDLITSAQPNNLDRR